MEVVTQKRAVTVPAPARFSHRALLIVVYTKDRTRFSQCFECVERFVPDLDCGCTALMPLRDIYSTPV